MRWWTFAAISRFYIGIGVRYKYYRKQNSRSGLAWSRPQVYCPFKAHLHINIFSRYALSEDVSEWMTEWDWHGVQLMSGRWLRVWIRMPKCFTVHNLPHRPLPLMQRQHAGQIRCRQILLSRIFQQVQIVEMCFWWCMPGDIIGVNILICVILISLNL